MLNVNEIQNIEKAQKIFEAAELDTNLLVQIECLKFISHMRERMEDNERKMQLAGRN